MRVNSKKPGLVFGALILALIFRGWSQSTPDLFFVDLGMNVPAKLIVSHRSPFVLTTMVDYLILKIPTSQVAAIQKILAAQSKFENNPANFPLHYAEFRAGNEQFLPKNCPRRFQSGGFYAYDRERHVYICRFLFDRDDARFTYLYHHSYSPIN